MSLTSGGSFPPRNTSLFRQMDVPSLCLHHGPEPLTPKAPQICDDGNRRVAISEVVPGRAQS